MFKKRFNDKKEISSNKNNSDIDEFALPEINFSTFIFSLNSSALVQLGVIKCPISGKKTTNSVVAKHTIDTISMLKNKTNGNLTSEESKMISNILYDLKMLYIKRCY